MNDVSAAHRSNAQSFADMSELDEGLSDELRARIKRELEPAERVLWAARCDAPVEPFGPGFYIGGALAIFFLGMGLFLIAASRISRHSASESTLGGGLACLGFACLPITGLIAGWNGRCNNRRRMANTLDAATDRRVIIWIPEPKGDAVRVQTLGRGQFKNLVRIERPDGSGTIEFHGMREEVDFGYFHAFTFAGIPDVRRVEYIVRNNLMTIDRSA